MTLGAVLGILGIKRLAPNAPGLLIVVMAASVTAAALKLPVETIGMRFDDLPHGLPAPRLPAHDWATLMAAFPYAVSFSLLGRDANTCGTGAARARRALLHHHQRSGGHRAIRAALRGLSGSDAARESGGRTAPFAAELARGSDPRHFTLPTAVLPAPGAAACDINRQGVGGNCQIRGGRRLIYKVTHQHVNKFTKILI